ncbi:MAG: GGDEF domain-containing protein [Proteobacteria bacterium]|nr:MAG: GGDEF domain-containing protein [Pseudomonadota bacterium]QKK11688.1 MAG: GGDEF domain-containing protein [Pseudomonadota bacterium]
MNLGAQRFDFRVIVWLCLATGLTLIPFTVLHAATGDKRLFLLIGGLAVLLIVSAYRIWRRGRVNETLVYFTGLSVNFVTACAIYFVGDLTIHWVYPVVVVNLVLLQPRAGLAANVVFVTIVLWAASNWLSLAELSRVAAALFILTTCVYFFSYSVSQQQDALRTLASVDPLTGAGNRRALHSTLAETVQSRQRYGCSASLLVLDLDHFKRVNDTHGHDRGDQLLRDVVQLLKRRLRSGDRVFRYGGEEFVIVAPHTPLTMAAQLAEDLRGAISRLSSHNLPVTVSLGVVELQHGEGADTWLKRGDQALYQAKAGGRNRTVAHGTCSGLRHDPTLVDSQPRSLASS